MKIKILMLMLLLLAEVAFGADYESGKIIVKIGNEVNDGEYEQFILNELDWLGISKVDHYLKPELLNAAKRKLDSKNNNRLLNNTRINSLSRIFYISYTKPFNPKTISQKISSNNMIEYSEPVYIYKIVEVPNDPRVQDQYHLTTIGAFEAWDSLDLSYTPIIGVVDTGVDLDHEDLADNIYINPGEDGIDENGNDKRTNGIDDDENGYIDDFQGWDFSSQTDSRGEDNEPNPGNRHGTHVAGISAAVTNNDLGVAGVNPYAKILPIKASRDLSFVSTIERGYEAIMYGAVVGADIINCSWGGQGRSEAGQEVIETVTEMGTLVVAAAGNNGSDQAFYPAAYDEIVSVASTTQAERKSGFSNYNQTVDVCAPGSAILATIPNSGYAALDGTSMASPVAAGVISMIVQMHPDYTPQDLREHIKATSDNIDQFFPFSIKGKMGKGRVNAFKAVTEKNPKSLLIQNVTFEDVDGDGAFIPGDEIICKFTIRNMLNDVVGLTYTADKTSTSGPDLSNINESIGDLNSLESSQEEIRFTLPDELSYDYEIEFSIDFTDEEGFTTYELITFTANQSYRDLETSLITTTVNSKGHIGFNDFPDNEQGKGFLYNGGDNILYEGALITTSSDARLSDVARSVSGTQNQPFLYISLISKTETDSTNILRTVFSDSAQFGTSGVEITQEIIGVTREGYENIIYIVNEFKNIRDEDFEAFYSGYYFDWDIGPSGQNNKCWFEDGIGKIYRTDDDRLPYIGSGIIEGDGFKVFALDNDGTTSDNPGVYDDFTDQEKIDIIRGNVLRTESNITDVSMLISTGPYEITTGESIKVVYTIFANDNEDDLLDSYEKAKEFWGVDGSLSIEVEPEFSIYPNPVINGELTIVSDKQLDIQILDLNGNVIFEQDNLLIGNNTINLDHLSSGNYFIRSQNTIQKISIAK